MIGASACANAGARSCPLAAAVSSRAAARLQYAGVLTFSPEGVLFVGDNISGAVFAYPMMTFDREMDHVLVRDQLEVVDAQGRSPAGEVTTAASGRVWSWRPKHDWRTGAYRLVVGNSLEELTLAAGVAVRERRTNDPRTTTREGPEPTDRNFPGDADPHLSSSQGASRQHPAFLHPLSEASRGAFRSRPTLAAGRGGAGGARPFPRPVAGALVARRASPYGADGARKDQTRSCQGPVSRPGACRRAGVQPRRHGTRADSAPYLPRERPSSGSSQRDLLACRLSNSGEPRSRCRAFR